MIAHTLIAYAFVMLMLLVALAAASLICRRGKLDGQATKGSGEWARKLVHMTMGLVCMTFPWLFRDKISVFILAALALISLVLVRFTPLAGALFSVGRKSTGDLLFPVAVAMTFALSQNAMQYFLALSLLTFADSTAAVIGKKYGQHFFAQGRKSLEGSLGFSRLRHRGDIVPSTWLRAIQ
jgi:phytol kinase